MLIALIGLCATDTYAQMCTPSGNVQPQVQSRSATAVCYALTNSNNYRVTVTVVVVHRGEVVSNEYVHVIEPNSRTPRQQCHNVSHWAGEKANFNSNFLNIRIISVVKCS